MPPPARFPNSLISSFLFRLFLWAVIQLAVLDVLLYAQGSRSFPQIKPAHLSLRVKNGESVIEEAIIKTKQNKPAYRLTIVSVSLDNESVQSIHVTLNGIGEASTRFDTKYEEDLLNSDRWGHGAEQGFTPNDFRPGKSNSNGRCRYTVFKLRRMKIKVVASEVVLNEFATDFIQARVTARVTRDPSTRSRPADVRFPIRACPRN